MSTALEASRPRFEPTWRRTFATVAKTLARPRPIRHHLIVLVIGATLPLLVFGALALWRVASAERAHYEQQLRHTATDLADDIDRAIDGMIVTLQTLSTSVNLQRGDFQKFHAQASTALSGSPFGVILLDPSGHGFVNSLVAYGTPLPRSADKETLARVLSSKQPEVSNLFLGALLKRPFLNVDMPVMVDGEVRYILLLVFEPSYIQGILRGQAFPPGWVTGVSDAHGRVIARSANHERYLNTRLPDELFKRRRDETVFEAKNLDGLPVLRAVARLRHTDWMTAATVPLSTVEAASRSAYWTLGLLGLTALVLSLGAASGLGGVLSRSVLQLEAASHAIKGAGPLSFQPMALAEAVTVQVALREAHRARHAAEEELRLTAERLALAARIAGVGHATITHGDDGTSVVDVSPELAALLGLPAGGPLPGDLASALVHPDDREEVAARFAAATEPGGDGLFQAEHRMLKPDGTVAWLDVRSTTFFQGDGRDCRPQLTVVAARDITARKQIDEALRASEARYRSALLVGRIASWETNFATRERLWTSEGKILFGLTIPGLIGRVGGPDDEYRNALHPDDRHLVEHFHRLAEGNDEFAAEYRIRHADGELLWVTGRGQVIERSASGKPIRLLSVVADITERKLAEDALKASETRFRMLAEAIPNIAWTATPDGVLDWHSPRWTEYTGTAPQLHDQASLGPIHADDRVKTLAAWHAAVADARSYEVEHRLRGKDGVYRWFLSRAIPVTGASDEVVAWVGTATNIEALKATEASLTRYVAVADAAHDGLISVTAEGVIESWNAGAERLFGYKSAEVLGQPTAMLVPEEALTAHRDMLKTVRLGGIVGPIDVKRRHKDGHLLDVAISMTGVMDERGATTAIAKVAHDISERIETERRLQLLNRELAHRVKNTFSVLQAVMRATLRSSSGLEEFAAAITGRLQSMAAAQDLLTDREWRNAELSELAQRQLAPHVAAGRMRLAGPRLDLPAELAVPLGLVLHELATNAVKYGALRVPQGRVSLTWSLRVEGTCPQVQIFWQERGGPPVVEPKRRGFGSVLIEQGLPTATVTREFCPDGVACTIVLPLQKQAAHPTAASMNEGHSSFSMNTGA